MAPSKLTDRAAPEVVSHTRASSDSPVSRLHPAFRVFLQVVLNLSINGALWQFVSNFLDRELGAISKVPFEDDLYSIYSPYARLGFRGVIILLTAFLDYDVYDVTALTVLTHMPFVYLITTFYDISLSTAAAHMNIEVLSIAIPTALLRKRSAAHDATKPLRNRFLLKSFQVQWSSALLASGVYVTVIYTALKSGKLTTFMSTHFEILTLTKAHEESTIKLAGKLATMAYAAKEFFLNPSIAVQPQSGAATPQEVFDASTATLPQTVKHNVWYFSKRTRTLIQQTAIANAFMFVNTVQKAMTLKNTEVLGAVGYASIWVFSNSLIALWYVWVGDSSADYEPL